GDRPPAHRLLLGGAGLRRPGQAEDRRGIAGAKEPPVSIPTNAELLAFLDDLNRTIGGDLESSWLDFKAWTGTREDMKTAIEYAVCLANADGGVIVFGIDDKKLGRAAAIHGASGYHLDTWRRGIYEGTRPN